MRSSRGSRCTANSSTKKTKRASRRRHQTLPRNPRKPSDEPIQHRTLRRPALCSVPRRNRGFSAVEGYRQHRKAEVTVRELDVHLSAGRCRSTLQSSLTAAYQLSSFPNTNLRAPISQWVVHSDRTTRHPIAVLFVTEVEGDLRRISAGRAVSVAHALPQCVPA